MDGIAKLAGTITGGALLGSDVAVDSVNTSSIDFAGKSKCMGLRAHGAFGFWTPSSFESGL